MAAQVRGQGQGRGRGPEVYQDQTLTLLLAIVEPSRPNSNPPQEVHFAVR